MDKLSQRLRDDADAIEATISAEFDDRIQASLHSISPVAAPAKPARQWSMWWASSITGVAAVIAILAVVNTQQPGPVSETEPHNVALVLPLPDLNAKSAVLVGPLQKEYEALQADLKKAEKIVKQDVGL